MQVVHTIGKVALAIALMYIPMEFAKVMLEELAPLTLLAYQERSVVRVSVNYPTGPLVSIIMIVLEHVWVRTRARCRFV